MPSPLFQAGAPRNGSALTGAPRNRIIDPATEKPWEPERGPDSGFAVPHVLQFSSILGSAWRTYWHGQHDEAMRFSWEDAWAMRNDTFIRSLIDERKLAVASLKWELVTDNDRDPWEKAVKAGVTQILRSFPRQADLTWSGLEALWYGRAGDQLAWRFREVDLPALPKAGFQSLGLPGLKDREKRKSLCLRNHQSVEGDKIDFDYDGNPYILVQAAAGVKARQQGAEVRENNLVPDLNAAHADLSYTTIGGRSLFLKGSWRQRFRIHTHECLDTSFFQPWKASSVHGVGIRSVIFWYWWLRQEFLSNVTDWCARTGLGVRIWYYDASSDASYKATKTAAVDQTDKVNIMVPRFPGADAQEGVQFIDTTGSGADLLLRIVEHTEQILERYIVGQSMSAGADEGSRGFGDRGRTDFAKNTKFQITKRDAEKLGDTDTEDMVKVVLRWSYPEFADLPLKKVYNVDNPDPESYMGAAKSFIDMGGTVRESEARSVVGFSEPHEDEPVLGGQQPAPPGMGGGGVPTGDAPPGGPPPDGALRPQPPQPEAKPSPFDDTKPLRHAVDTANRFEGDGKHARYSRWITIGGREEGDEKHKGGFHVEIDGEGKIIRGGAGVMHGKKIHEAVEALHKMSEEDKEKPAEKPAHSAPVPAPSYPQSVMAAHKRSLEKPEAKAPSDPQTAAPSAAQPSTEAPIRSEQEARALFDGLPKSQLSGLPKVAEQVAAKFAKYDTEQWQDYAQEASIKIFEAAQKVQNPQNFEAVAHTVASNHIRDLIDKSGAQKRGKDRTKQFGEDFDHGEVQGARHQPEAMDIHEVLAGLDPEHRKVAELVMDGNTLDEIAAAIGMNRVKVHRTLKNLQPAFESVRHYQKFAEKIRYMLAEQKMRMPIIPEVWDEIINQSKQYGPRAPDFIRAVMEAMNDTDSQWEGITLGRQQFLTHGANANGKQRNQKPSLNALAKIGGAVLTGAAELPADALTAIKTRIERLPPADRLNVVGAFKLSYGKDRPIEEVQAIADCGPVARLIYQAHSDADDPAAQLIAARVAVDRAIADIAEEPLQKERYEAESARKRKRAEEAEREASRERESDKRLAAMIEKLKPEPFDVAALARAIQSMPAPVVNVKVPEQPGLDLEALARTIHGMMPPPLDLEALAKVIRDDRKGRTVKITKNKDGQYTARIEE